jgi:ferrochelatase
MIKRTTWGVLLLNFGGPETLEDVEPFLTHILGSGRVSPEMVSAAKKRYHAIGGGSPLLSITKLQTAKLERELNLEGDRYRVYIGMLHAHPFIFDTMKQMASEGVERIFVLTLAPFYSRFSTGAYYTAVKNALEELHYYVPVEFAKPWYSHPLFIQAMAQRINRFLQEQANWEEGYLVFSAHSLPIGSNDGDVELYCRHFQETVELITQKLNHCKYRIAYQSRGGNRGKWLEPDILEVIESLWQEGERHIIIIPAGFVSDHVETLYDLDIDLKSQARNQGIRFQRCPALNDDPFFIQALASIITGQVGNGVVLK